MDSQTAILSETAEKPSEEQKPPFFLDLGLFRNWGPTPEDLQKTSLFPDTSFAACLMYIVARRGCEPYILLVRQNPNDPEKWAQAKGGPVHTRPDGWKAPIGRFYPNRYLDDNGAGVLDRHLFDTVTEEWFEETGIDPFDPQKHDDDEIGEVIGSIMQAPIADYRGMSKRVGSRYHIDRVHFWINPRFFCPQKDVWKKQRELKDVLFFPLCELPRADLNGDGAGMIYSHVKRLVDFFDCPQASKIKWQGGIPDDISARIRERFPEYRNL